MKELSIKEKAERYDRAIEKAHQFKVMKKYAIRILGWIMLLCMGLSMSLWTVTSVVLLLHSVVYGIPYEKELFFPALITLPMLCYSWRMWCTDFSTDMMKKILFYENNNN